jgi:hypothetical protein
MKSQTLKKWWVPHCPDFLRRVVALIHSMRLSLMKGAHADLSGTAWQEIGVKPCFACPGVPRGLSGQTKLSIRVSSTHAMPQAWRGTPA